MSDYLMVPAKYSVLNVTNKNERMIYIPVATTETPGIVRIGNGLKIDYYGLLSLSDDVESFMEKVNAGDIVSKGFYQYRTDFKYPKNSVVFYNKEFYVSLVDENDAAITDLSKWSSVGIRSQLDAKEVYLSNGKNVESAINDILNNKVDKVSAPFYIDNTQEKVEMSYAPNRGSSAAGSSNKASISIDKNNIVVERILGPTGRENTAKLTFGTNRPVLSTNNETERLNSPLAVLDDLNDIESAVNNKLSSKQDKKPNGTTNLINDATGKLDNAYLPDILSGTSRKFAGTFSENGVIVASAYASEINGQLITKINLSECVGYEFSYTGETPFLFDDIEVNKNDLIVCNGDKEPNWTLYDNSDKVVSVNGQTGAVQINIPEAGIEHLVGTEEKPINMATDMEVGKLYGASGKIYLGNLDFPITITGNLIFYKAEASKVGVFNCYGNANQLFYSPGTYTEYKITSSGDAAGVVGSYRTFSSIDTLNGSRSSNGAYIYAPNSGGTPGQILKSNGSGAAPTWIDLPTGGIEELVGTEDAPINFATDMEVGHLYSVSGTVTLSETITVNVVDNVLIFKYSETWIQVLNGYATNGLLAAQTGVFSNVRINNSTGYIGTTNLYTTLDKLNGSEYLQPREIYAPLNSGEAGQILQTNGSSKAPTWVDMPSSGIETLTGTDDNPINFANLEVGKFYLLSGVFRISSRYTATAYNILMFKATATLMFSFNGYLTSTTIIASVGAMTKFVIDSSTGYISNPEASVGILSFNGSRRNSAQSFYAPISGGTKGQILQSNGNSAVGPIWVDANYATLDDITNAIGNVSTLLGDTSDLEV